MVLKLRVENSHTVLIVGLTILVILIAIPLIASNITAITAKGNGGGGGGGGGPPPKPANVKLDFFEGYDAKKGWTSGEIDVHPGDEIRFRIGLKNDGDLVANGLFVHIHYDSNDGKGVASLEKTGGSGTYDGPKVTDTSVCSGTGDRYYNVTVGDLSSGGTVELDFNATISSSASWKGASVHMGHICIAWVGEPLKKANEIPLLFIPEFTAGTVAPIIGASIALCGFLLTRRLRFKAK